MGQTTTTRHKRGFFGRVWQVIFWLFQAAMIGLIFINYNAVGASSAQCAGDAACNAGVGMATGAFAVIGWLIWILGTVIFGILMLSTRGKSVTTVN